MSLDHRQIERDAAQWLARRDAGAWTPADEAELDDWLRANLAHRVAFLRLESAWDEAARLKTLAAGGHHAVPARGAWAQSPYFADLVDSDTARRRVRKRRQRPWIGLAASLAIAVALMGGLAWQALTRVDHATWTTAPGGQQVVQLADGSTATLGGASELRTSFSRRARNLELVRGEAFFDVAHDATRPFVVHAGGYRVIAVGTRFDVRHDDPGHLRVVVTRGLVRLQPADDSGQPASMLPAGSIALVAGNRVAVTHMPLDEARERLSWRDGYAVFHGTPLAEAVQEFNRYSTHRIVLADPALGALRVGGNFRLDNSAAFVRLMQQIFPLQVEQHGDRTVLSRRAEAKSAH
jgi:transmembrane sensor